MSFAGLSLTIIWKPSSHIYSNASVRGDVGGNVIFAMICFPYALNIMFYMTTLV